MKKMISLACALMMMLGVSAMPKMGARKVSMQDLTSTVDGAVAWRAEGTTTLYQNGKSYYQFQIVFENNETPVAALTIYTLAADKLAGVYAIAPTNGSYYYVNGNKLPIYGYMSLECKVAQGASLGTYEVVAVLFDGQGNSVTMTGTMPDFIAVDYAKYTTDPATAGIPLKDAVGLPGSLIEVYTGQTEELDETSYAETGYWGYLGNDYDHSVQCWMAFQTLDNNYVIGDGAYFVESGYVSGIDWTTSSEVNPSNIMRGVMEVEYTSDTEANFSAFLQCEDGNVYFVYDFDMPAGVEEIEAAETEGTAKVMKDGQLIIIRNGVRYNAQGALVD